jgi:hypothetical protein
MPSSSRAPQPSTDYVFDGRTLEVYTRALEA